jgi:hypothetical protein
MMIDLGELFGDNARIAICSSEYELMEFFYRRKPEGAKTDGELLLVLRQRTTATTTRLTFHGVALEWFPGFGDGNSLELVNNTTRQWDSKKPIGCWLVAPDGSRGLYFSAASVASKPANA